MSRLDEKKPLPVWILIDALQKPIKPVKTDRAARPAKTVRSKSNG